MIVVERELGGIREEGEVGSVRLVSGDGGLLSFVGLDEGEEFVLGEYGVPSADGLFAGFAGPMLAPAKT